MKDYYGIFGLSFGAPKEAVEAACRRVVERRGSGETLSRDIREAYKVLCSDATRAAYDAACVSEAGSDRNGRVSTVRETPDPLCSGADASSSDLPKRQPSKILGGRESEPVTKRVRAARPGKKGASGRRRTVPVVSVFVIVSLVVAGMFLFQRYVVREREETLQEGLEKFSQGEFREASELLEAGGVEGVDDPSALLKLGASYYNQRKYDEAISAYEKAVSLDDRNTVAYNSLGNAYRDKQESDRAIAMYRKAIETDPKFPLAYSNLAILLMDSGNREEARSVVDEGLSVIPDSQELKNIGSYIGG